MSFALRLRRLRALASTLFTLLSLCIITNHSAQAAPSLTGYSPTDFLVAGFDQDVIAVYDQNFNFKGYLDANFNGAVGLDIMPNGNVIGSGQNSDVRQYNAAGTIVSSFSHPIAEYSLDTKFASNNRIYIGTAVPNYSVSEFTLGGTPQRTFGSKGYYGVAVLPNGTMWATGDEISGIDVYSLSSGSFIKNIPFDAGQGTAYTLTYNPQTNTVLMGDAYTDAVYERTLSGDFMREYNIPDNESLSDTYGVTRGPNGNVYATDYSTDKVYYWNSSGTYLGAIDISTTANGPCNIIWMGNASTYNSSVNAAGTLRNKEGAIQVSLWAANNKNGLGGGLSYTDKPNKTTVQSTQITAIVVQGNTARVYGICKVNGEAGYSFVATVADYYPTFLGRGDIVELEVLSNFSNGGVFNPGDAKIAGSQGLIIVP